MFLILTNAFLLPAVVFHSGNVVSLTATFCARVDLSIFCRYKCSRPISNAPIALFLNSSDSNPISVEKLTGYTAVTAISEGYNGLVHKNKGQRQ